MSSPCYAVVLATIVRVFDVLDVLDVLGVPDVVNVLVVTDVEKVLPLVLVVHGSLVVVHGGVTGWQ
jgi:hypothetical protein